MQVTSYVQVWDTLSQELPDTAKPALETFLATGLADTQCGFKAFNASAAKEIFRRVTIDGFGFDVEMIYIARKLKYSIQPVAVQMIDRHRASRVRLVEDSVKMFINLFTVRWLDWQGKYK